MGKIDALAEQHLRLYQSRLRHLDELIEKSRTRLKNHSEREIHEAPLSNMVERRDELALKLRDWEMKDPTDLTEEIQKAGPIMAVWDVLAADLERLLEKLGM